jgi:hypothetical protein
LNFILPRIDALKDEKYEDFEFYTTRKDIKEIFENFEVKKKSKKAPEKSTGEGLNANELIVLMDWFTPLLRIVCRKVVKESDLKWVPMKGRDNVKMLFIHDPQGFTSCGSILKKALPHEKIDVLIADSDYGIKEEEWDKVAWKSSSKP